MWQVIAKFRVRQFLLVALLVLSSTIGAMSPVFADGACPPGMSQLDCDALYGTWTRWVPDTGTCGSGTTTTADTELSGSDNRQKAYNFFLSKGLNDVQVSGLIGNFMIESGMVPTADNGSHRGIAQWDYGDRFAKLKKYAGQQKLDPDDLATQLNFVWMELNGTAPAGDYSDVLTQLKKFTNESQVPAAATFVQNNYEVAVGQATQERRQAAQKAYDDLAGSAAGTVSGSTAACGSVGAVDCSNPSAPESSAGLSQLRQNVVCLAKQELALWESGKMKAGTDFHKYSENRTESWCADFASWIYKEAGYTLGPTPTDWNVPLVSQVKQIGEDNVRFHYHAADSYIPKPGDIIVHQENGQSHVNIVISVDTEHTSMVIIGGNQHGSGGPTGNIVSQYTDSAFSGVDDITGYVSPD